MSGKVIWMHDAIDLGSGSDASKLIHFKAFSLSIWPEST